jgi:hypothetical protein
MEVTLFIWSYCWDMKKIITKSGISLNAGTLNRGFTAPSNTEHIIFIYILKKTERHRMEIVIN